jgi:aryl-alcohol dehydrogenase-like predicted oxidoreductase
MERLMRAEKLGFVQVNYSLAEPEADERLLPLAAERGIAVIVNRPFAEGALFDRVRGRALPAWAAEFGAASWAQFFLKWILGRPEVTVAIPATRNPKHLADNLAAGSGPLPDAATRKRMLDLLRET